MTLSAFSIEFENVNFVCTLCCHSTGAIKSSGYGDSFSSKNVHYGLVSRNIEMIINESIIYKTQFNFFNRNSMMFKQSFIFRYCDVIVSGNKFINFSWNKISVW